MRHRKGYQSGVLENQWPSAKIRWISILWRNSQQAKRRDYASHEKHLQTWDSCSIDLSGCGVSIHSVLVSVHSDVHNSIFMWCILRATPDSSAMFLLAGLFQQRIESNPLLLIKSGLPQSIQPDCTSMQNFRVGINIPMNIQLAQIYLCLSWLKIYDGRAINNNYVQQMINKIHFWCGSNKNSHVL